MYIACHFDVETKTSRDFRIIYFYIDSLGGGEGVRCMIF